MKLEAAICPFCSGDLRIPPDRQTILCMYCGKTIIVQEAIAKTKCPSVESLMAIAAAARESKNYEEAHQYYTKVLELDPTNFLAWFFKGEAAGWQSTLNNFRFGEICSGIENALKFVPQENRELIKAEGACLMNDVAVAYHKLILEHMMEYGYTSESHQNYFDQCANVSDALYSANCLDPKNGTVIDSMISLLMEYIEGVEYKDNDEYETIRVFRPARDQNLIMPELNKYIAMKKAIDPTYQPRAIKKKGRFSLF
jgi:hypothetical protein